MEEIGIHGYPGGVEYRGSWSHRSYRAPAWPECTG
jgi:hypothetical protein